MSFDQFDTDSEIAEGFEKLESKSSASIREPMPTKGNIDIQSESDPNGIDPHSPGAKLDDGKVMAGLLEDFSLVLMEIAKVCTYGATKYSIGGWQSVPDGINRYKHAAWRHRLQKRYEQFDKASGLDHEAQEIWNMMAVMELKLRTLNRKEQ